MASSGICVQVVKEMGDRLLDFDDKVRAAAATAICTAAISTPRVNEVTFGHIIVECRLQDLQTV